MDYVSICVDNIGVQRHISISAFYIFIYLGFYFTFNTVQVISQRVVGRAEETSTYSLSGFCTVKCRPTASNYQLSHLRLCREPNPGLRGGRRECYHSATMALSSFCITCKLLKILETNLKFQEIIIFYISFLYILDICLICVHFRHS